MSSRVRRALKLVQELELDTAEVQKLRADLGAFEECEVDLSGANENERAELLAIKSRVDTFLRGETQPVTMAQGNAIVRAELRRRRQLHRTPAE